MLKTYYSHGKLLLTGEYVVLDGAKALAIPTHLGQKMTVRKINKPLLKWRSYLADKSVWFSQEYCFENKKIRYQLNEKNPQNNEVIKNLSLILQEVFNLSSHLNSTTGYEINSFLEFPKNWGLGSSSTLVYNLAQWAKIDPFMLLEKTFGGSGYDIACAEYDTPILYRNHEAKSYIQPVLFQPEFADHIFFVYLNQKKNSRDAIQHYRSLTTDNKLSFITEINEITEALLNPKIKLSEFEKLIYKHESILSRLLQIPTIKEQRFSDYKGSIKSLGGWGGDFILATGSLEMMDYFKNLGYTTIVPFQEMIFLPKKHKDLKP